MSNLSLYYLCLILQSMMKNILSCILWIVPISQISRWDHPVKRKCASYMVYSLPELDILDIHSAWAEACRWLTKVTLTHIDIIFQQSLQHMTKMQRRKIYLPPHYVSAASFYRDINLIPICHGWVILSQNSQSSHSVTRFMLWPRQDWIPPRQLCSRVRPRSRLTDTTSVGLSGLAGGMTQTIVPQGSSHHTLPGLGCFAMSIYNPKWAMEHLENSSKSSRFHANSSVPITLGDWDWHIYAIDTTHKIDN